MASPVVGFQKLAFSPRLTGAALGGTLGFAASPEDEGQAAGLTGAAMGYGAGALADRLRQRLAGGAGPPAAAPAPAPTPTLGGGHSPAELAAAHQEIERHLNPQPGHINEALQAQRAAPAPVQMGHLQAAKTRVGAWPHPVKLGSVGFGKIADYSAGAGVGPMSLGVSSKDERLEGMNRWVPRGTIERAYQGLDQGLDPQALMEEAGESGNLKHPAVGAGLAAALAHFGLPGMGPTRLGGSAKALAALVGAGGGAIYNQATAGQRSSDMGEAVKGVQHEKQKSMGHHTAREAMPLIVSGAGDNH